MIAETVPVPVIASGGAGTLEHLRDGIAARPRERGPRGLDLPRRHLSHRRGQGLPRQRRHPDAPPASSDAPKERRPHERARVVGHPRGRLLRRRGASASRSRRSSRATSRSRSPTAARPRAARSIRAPSTSAKRAPSRSSARRRTRRRGDAETSVRAILAKLLEASGSATPALTASAKRKPGAGLPALVAELEAALIPVNRAAGRRALARLAREVKRVTLGVGRNASVPPPAPRAGAQPRPRAEGRRPRT